MRKYEEIQEIYESFGDQITTNWAISKPCHSFIVEVLGGTLILLK